MKNNPYHNYLQNDVERKYSLWGLSLYSDGKENPTSAAGRTKGTDHRSPVRLRNAHLHTSVSICLQWKCFRANELNVQKSLAPENIHIDYLSIQCEYFPGWNEIPRIFRMSFSASFSPIPEPLTSPFLSRRRASCILSLAQAKKEGEEEEGKAGVVFNWPPRPLWRIRQTRRWGRAKRPPRRNWPCLRWSCY